MKQTQLLIDQLKAHLHELSNQLSVIFLRVGLKDRENLDALQPVLDDIVRLRDSINKTLEDLLSAIEKG
jgi:sensor histidine kinase regulating citrate/malate metabolism